MREFLTITLQLFVCLSLIILGIVGAAVGCQMIFEGGSLFGIIWIVLGLLSACVSFGLTQVWR